MKELIEFLSKIQITKGETRHIGKEVLLNLMSSPALQKSYTVTDVDECRHISCLAVDRFWVSDGCKLILKDTNTGETLYRADDSRQSLYGFHTVNNEGALFYIDEYHNIIKMSPDLKTKKKFIRRLYSAWQPHCLYCSPLTGDLLVGMFGYCALIGTIHRYNPSGQHTQSIEYENKHLSTFTSSHPQMHSHPYYITENNNGDIVVADTICGVVVTDCAGNHRFTHKVYQAHKIGICTDVMSHILVCDWHHNSVEILDQDGKYLSKLKLEESNENALLFSLSYDINTDLLWIGSWGSNKVSVYRYLNRDIALTEKMTLRDNSPAHYNDRCLFDFLELITNPTMFALKMMLQGTAARASKKENEKKNPKACSNDTRFVGP
uniref:Uncharacterized protein LOC111103145 n=1 Tax=Crassostrea virginica TaxID=6565 RepID=A0A8B8AL32_CRAVI|nr:uncharacterized protein LOC111103145 [Crassostrea virginica]